MKYLKPTLIAFGAIMIVMLFSSFFQPQENESIPRYHMIYTYGNEDIIVYDAVNGKYKKIKYKDFKKNSSIKELLKN